MATSAHQVVILGAGLCGLSAGYHLEQKGLTDYLILERESEVGGLARTVSVDGFSFDHAIHILYSRDPYAIELICGRLLKKNLRRAVRESYCYTTGVYTEYPYQANNYGLPPEVVLENIVGLIDARYRAPRDRPPNFEAWIYETYGRGIADHFMIPYNRRQWAWDLKEMNYDWIADRVPTPDIREVIRGALEPPHRKFGPNQEFWYPSEGGIAAVPKAFLRYIPRERIRLGTAALAVDGRRREVSLAGGQRVRYDRLISTIPLPVLVRLLGKTISQRVRHCASALEGNVVHTVNIGLEGTDLADVDSMHWIYFPEEKTVFHRLSLPRNFSPWMVPDGCASIQLEISESRYRRHQRSTLIQEALSGLVQVGVLREREARLTAEGGRVRLARRHTLDPAYVIYDLKHRKNTQIIRDELRKLNVSTHGRFGEWEYLNMDGAILSGKAAVDEGEGFLI